ncbi:hypothetical protein Hanom_Chr10g00931361 [Helianthus anomalus]
MQRIKESTKIVFNLCFLAQSPAVEVMLCCSRQIEERVYEDRATLQELKRCFDELHVDLFTREQVSRNLMRMPSTSIRDLCVVGNTEIYI